MKKLLQKLKCFFGFHPWKYHFHNIETEQGTITIGFKDCFECGSSKIVFTYGC